MDIIIGLFFWIDIETGELLDAPLVAPYENVEQCEQYLIYLKTEAPNQAFNSTVVGVCIDGEEIH